MNTKEEETIVTFAQRLARLPEFQPGRIITVPLDLWPAYMEKYGLKPAGLSAIGNLFVKREDAQ